MDGEARLVLKVGGELDAALTLDAVLITYEDIVTDVEWKPAIHNEAPCLLSASNG